MIKGKRGMNGGWVALIVIGCLAGIGILVYLLTILTPATFSFSIQTTKIGEVLTTSLTTPPLAAVNMDYLNFLSFIFGEIPNDLITQFGGIQSVIILIGIFLMFFFTFGDIISSFGSFSKPVAWTIGTLLVIILANFKVISVAAFWAFGIVAAGGALAVLVGVAVPIFIFLVLNLILVGQLKNFRNLGAMKTGADETGEAIKGFRRAAKAFRESV